jgi:exodeoxyribonuclease V alpha subunit
LLEVDQSILETALATLAQQDRVLIEELPEVRAVYLTPLHVAEANVAKRLKALIGAPKQPLQIDVEKAIEWVQGQ